MLGAIAQFEAEIRSERQADGISNPLEKEEKFDRKHVLTPKDVEELKQTRGNGGLYPL